MWVITVYSEHNHPKMFEFNNEKEAKEAYDKIKGSKFLSQIVYYNDFQ
ncbi:hypothetical protein [Metabacillus endolithicus]|uniref:Uncharacterized protein n=1 Tax=Metabacillus endolithicus TaxID=1535204 RepID=A0ABW5BYA2_9BACI|nr:hypothetical protein [Metabacillus endolithicus]UPG65677.1 hypothetical protein MVE64_12290 [Metabacillus endolithicus]